MKKTLALVLALAMVFSTITVAFAEETLGADAQICADLGMLKGETGTVDAAYVATAPTRLQAAVMFLRLKGLEAEALAFTGEENFADGNIAWAEGANLLAYLKANPQLGWVGDGVNFNPSAPISAKEYYKVLLETLGYKQTTTEVVGDFTWENVIEFAATVGLSKVADVTNFTVNDLAVATVEALKINVKDTEKTLLATLVEAGKITEEAAVATGLMEGAAQGGTLTAEVDDVYAVGNAVVQVEFVDPVDEAAATNLANYSIEGLAINAVTYVPAGRANGDDRVILETAAQTAGKLYTLTVGDKTAQFSGLAKLSDGPEIEASNGVESVDVEEVVINFDRNIDYATGSDVANYSISGVTIVKAEVDRDEVTLTTEGLKDGQKYTVKCTNIKSVDLVNRKTTSDDFKVDYDTTAPKISGDIKVDTNTRIIVYFNEEVDETTAEDIANYSIKVNDTDGAALEIVSIEWDGDDENNVEITTEPMTKREEYKITVNGIADQCKVPNVMAKATSKTFDGVAEDKDEPNKLATGNISVLSPTKFMVHFTDDGSRLDAASILDKSNYEFECDDAALDIEDITEYDSDTKYFDAIFTVEEMTTDEQCTLTYVDIMDEYGNTVSEDDVSFYARSANFTSASLLKANAYDENKIVLVFDKDLDEDSVENLANYSIDGDIGTPTDAEYESSDIPAAVLADLGTTKDKTVLLTVNDLIEGNKYYEITIDGLKDLAGNELFIDGRDVNVTAVNEPIWDTECEFSDVDAANPYVVSLSFDEEVQFNGNEQIKLSTANNAAPTITLTAKSISDEDTVLEFSNYPAQALTATTYYVYSVDNILDNAGNEFTVQPWEYDFNSSNDDPEYAEFESIEQVDAKTFKVVMSRDVTETDADDIISSVAVDSSYVVDNFTITVDDDDNYDTTVYLRSANEIQEDKDYAFRLWSFLEDEHGIAAEDDDNVVTTKDANNVEIPTAGVTEIAGDNEDTDAPEIDEVVALDRQYIEVRFDENLNQASVKGAINTYFKLENVDTGDDVDIDSVYVDGEFEDNVLVIELGDLLEGRYEYELTIEANALSDYAANWVAEDTFTFDGTYLAEHE